MKKILLTSSLLLSGVIGAAEPRWTLFENPDLSTLDLTQITAVPKTLGGVKGKQIRMEHNSYSIARKQYRTRENALFFCELDSSKAQMVNFGCGADYFFELRVNGKVYFNTLQYGNSGHYPPKSTDFLTEIPLKKGKNLICILLQSGSGGFTLAAEIFPPRDHKKELAGFTALSKKFKTARKSAMAMIQKGVDNMRSNDFAAFDSEPELSEERKQEFYWKHPILLFYDQALDRILQELPSAKVPKGGVILWHLYNMGYVIKTESSCFGIDLHHRRAKLLAPYLDFLLTTHNHGDHYNMPLLKEMAKQGKFIYSNFYPCKGFSHGNSTVKIKDLTITMEETDHNNTLKGFVKTFQIRCGEQPGACVIYHVGDSRNDTQLNPYGKVDIFILHPKVGLSSEAACKKIQPELTLFSHLLEMGHCYPCQYFPVPFGMIEKDDMVKLDKLGLKYAMPLWGEKLVWKPEK